MNEWYGNSFQIQTQQNLLAEQEWISKQDGLLSQGRTLLFFDTDNFSIEFVVSIIRKFWRVLINVKTHEFDIVINQLKNTDLIVNDMINVYSAETVNILNNLENISEEINFPENWSLEKIDEFTPEEVIHSIQNLCSRSGLNPLPGAFIRGQIVRCHTLVLYDDNRKVVGCATIQDLSEMKSHFLSKWKKSIMVLCLCLHEDIRGLGLSSLLNAKCLLYGIEKYSASYVYELIENGNIASIKMSNKCGLCIDDEERFAFIADISDFLD